MPTSEIKTVFKHIYFEKENPKDLGILWSCYNHIGDELLGIILKKKRWGQYVMTSQFDIDLSSSCHRDIADFLDQLNK